MPVYSSQQLKDKIKNNFDCRKLELPYDVWKKIWIPEDAQLYHRIHFKVKTRTPFKNSKYDVLDCFNQEPGQEGKGCPICDYMQELWAEWRDANKKKDVQRKKDLQAQINAITVEEYWLNGIDLEDTEFMFQGIRFTRAKFEDYLKIVATRGVGQFGLRYKKEKGPPVGYTIVEDDINDTIKTLMKSLDKLKERSYEMGGEVDLDKIARSYKSLDHYKAILHGADDSEEGSDNHPEPTKQTKPSINIDESESSISLDDVGLDIEAKPAEKKPETKVEEKSIPADDLSLDAIDLGTDDISLDDVEEIKYFDVSVDTFKQKWEAEKSKCEPWINKIYTQLFVEKKIPECKDLPSKVKGIFAFLKTQTSPVKIKE